MVLSDNVPRKIYFQLITVSMLLFAVAVFYASYVGRP